MIGDVGSFPDSERLCSYAGLVPSESSSCGRIRRERKVAVVALAKRHPHPKKP